MKELWVTVPSGPGLGRVERRVTMLEDFLDSSLFFGDSVHSGEPGFWSADEAGGLKGSNEERRTPLYTTTRTICTML